MENYKKDIDFLKNRAYGNVELGIHFSNLMAYIMGIRNPPHF